MGMEEVQSAGVSPEDRIKVAASVVHHEVDGFDYLYVDPLGDDTNDGSAEYPLRTIQEANRRVEKDGVVILRSGCYEGPITITCPRTWWQAGEGEKPVIVGDGKEPLITVAAEVVRIQDFWLDNAGGRCLVVDGCKRGIDIDCIITTLVPLTAESRHQFVRDLFLHREHSMGAGVDQWIIKGKEVAMPTIARLFQSTIFVGYLGPTDTLPSDFNQDNRAVYTCSIIPTQNIATRAEIP